MFAIRQVLISTLIFATVPSVATYGADNIQYVGGTVKSIPVNTTGTFSFEDAKEFRFNYNGSVFKLPYDQITSTDIEKADVRRVLHVFPAMSPIASHRKQTLVINYTDAAGATGTVNFELAEYRAVDAQETLAAKKSPVPSYAAAAKSNEWWGNSVWKTKRNQGAWDAEAAKNAQALQEAEAKQAAQNAAATQAAQPVPAATK